MKPVSYGLEATVGSVTDGDTLVAVVNGEERKVRILGIDCPEASHNPKCRAIERKTGVSCDDQILAGKRATEAAKQLLQGPIWLEAREPGAELKRDRYGRFLAYVRLEDGRDFGEVMVGEHGCEDFGWKYPHPRNYQAPR